MGGGDTDNLPVEPSSSPLDALLAEPSEAPGPAVTVRNLPGRVLAVVSPVPPNILSLKATVKEQTGIPVALQRFIEAGGTRTFADSDSLPQEATELLLVVDETPMYHWDFDNNPSKEFLEVDGGVVKCPKLTTDYVNVVTKEPIRTGTHYYQFVMHRIGDEQWCGLVEDAGQAGSQHGGRDLMGWLYYCGRMGSARDSVVDGEGALHAQGRAVTKFEKLRSSGDVIGMLADLEKGAVAFDLNGKLQGACPIPKDTPLYVLTHVDRPEDHVELRKPSLQDAPPENLEALQGALLDIVNSGIVIRPWRE